jgi:sporulation protein YlmC with PRC-barrel domain
MMNCKTFMSIAGLSVFAIPAAAQDMVDAGTIIPEDWNYNELYSSEAWSVDDFFGRDVVGSDGALIGDVEDVVLNDAGDVVALIAEVGGFWDIGDTHVSVPWDMVEIDGDGDGDGSVGIPLTEENVAEFDLFSSSPFPDDADLAASIVEGVENEELGMVSWRASDLIGDYVRVQGDEENWVNFGYVSDLLIDGGSITATLVSTTGRYGQGTYAYPYPRGSAEGYGVWMPNATTQDLPVLVGDATSMPLFEMEQMQAN